MECILLSSEIEFYIDTMRPHEIQDIGSESWLEWHDRLQKLNQEAVIEASNMKDEQVKETLISFNKSPTLVYEVILINVWKQKIFPLLFKIEPNPETTFIVYSILYHENVGVSLLELLLFHSGGCESLGESAADLLEYAYDNAVQLLVIDCKTEEDVSESGIKEILRQKEGISFDIAIRCLSIIRYLCEFMDRTSIGLTNRIYNVHDIPVMLVQILLEKPWSKNGKIYRNGKWIFADSEALCQPEAQIWLALRHLLLDQACTKYYDLTESRRSQLMKLLPLFSPTLLDQLAPLVELNRWLYQMSVSNLASAPNRPLLLETILEIQNSIMKQGERKWKKIAKQQADIVFCNDKQRLCHIAQKLSAAYNTDILEKFEAKSKEVCKICGKDAVQRCSRCKKDWYCSRSCQVDDWPNHKDQCSTIEQT